MTRTRALAAAATAGLLTLTLASCSDDTASPDGGTDSTGGTSQSSSSSEDSAPTRQNRSDAVFGASEKPEVLGSATGKVGLGISSNDEEAVIFEVTGVTASANSTVLRYQLTAKDGDAAFGMEGRFWYDQPTLSTPGADTQLQTVTAAIPKGEHEQAQERCVCTSVRFAGPDPRSQTALYPPLPEDATKAEVTLPGLDPVTVPITR